MIRVLETNGEPTIVVTHSLTDKVLIVVCLLFSLVLVLWYFRSSIESQYSGIFFASLFSVFLFAAFIVFRTRLAISRESIEERLLITRRIGLPSGVFAVGQGPVVRIHETGGGTLYETPGYLSHRGRLAKAVMGVFPSETGQ